MAKRRTFRWGIGADLKWVEPRSFTRLRVLEWMDRRHLPTRLKIFAATILATGGIGLLTLPPTADDFVFFLGLLVLLGLFAAYGTALWMWYFPVKVSFTPEYLHIPIPTCRIQRLKWDTIKTACLGVQQAEGHVF